MGNIGTLIKLLLFVILVGCVGCQEQPSDVKVFKYNQTDHITSLDPAFAKSQNNIWAVNHIFEGLLKLDDELNIVPSLARSYEISDNGLRYTFTLQSGVYFHKSPCFANPDSTRAVTAYDVAYSLGRLLDSNISSPGSWLFADKVADASAFMAVNDSVFVIELSKPFVPTLGILTMQYCSVVPREAVDYYGSSWAQHPVGTGPYQFRRWVENQALYLIRNKSYHTAMPSDIDGIKTTFIPDRKIAFLELMNGNLDFVSGLESSFAPMLLSRSGELKPEHSSSIQFQKAPYLNTEYLGINITATEADSPLRHKAFRQALNYGIDRKLMLTALRNGVGKSATAGFIPAGLPSHDPAVVQGYSYDKQRAIELIKSSGYEDINSVPQIQLYTNKDYLDLTTYIAKQWEELGLDISLEVMESGMLRQSMRSAELPLFRASWIADYPDGESFLCMFYSKYPAPPNYTRYKNPAFDQLYEKAIVTTDAAEKISIYQQMDRLLVEDAPVIFLFYDETALFSSTSIKGVSSNAVNLLKVDSLTKSPSAR